MTETGGVQSWVFKAVFDITRFDEQMTKANTASEQKALSALLATPNLEPCDEIYIRGVQNGSIDAVVFDGYELEKNEDKVVEIDFADDVRASSLEISNKLKNVYAKTKLFFDEDGSVVRREVRGSNDEINILNTLTKIDENKKEFYSEQKLATGSVLTQRSIMEKGKGKQKVIDITETKGGSVIWEQHLNNDGSTIRTFYPNTINMTTEQRHEYQTTGAVTTTVRETFSNGVARREVLKNGVIISTQTGTYQQDSAGNVTTVSYNR